MDEYRPNSVLRRWLGAALFGCLGLILVAAGCSRNEAEPPEKVAVPEKPDRPIKEDAPPPAATEEPPLRLHQAVFMGTPAVGRRFCIIADASNSMAGQPLKQLKKEILQTLEGLDPGSQFYVIFFHATDVPMPSPTWLDASKDNVDKVRPWVENTTTVVKTLPQSAFERAFKLTPKPDVIFFMTDGQLQGKPDPITHVSSLNSAEPRVVVHTIMFSKAKLNPKKDTKATAQLRTIAEKNGGTFRVVAQK